MCDFPEFTLDSSLNDLAGWVGFNYFFYLLGATAFLWFLQKYYWGLKADRGYFPSTYIRLLVEFVLLNATAMAAWISHTCKDWDNADGVVVHSVYVFWLFSFALQIASLVGPRMIWVAAFVTSLSAILSLVNVILCAVYVYNIWSLLIYVATTIYLAYMALNLIVVTVWPKKGSRSTPSFIADYADAWDVGVACHAKVCTRAVQQTSEFVPESQPMIASDGDMTSGTETSGTDGDESAYEDEDRPLPQEEPKQKRMGFRLRSSTVKNDTDFKLPQ